MQQAKLNGLTPKFVLTYVKEKASGFDPGEVLSGTAEVFDPSLILGCAAPGSR
jgi:hypothetical protein